MTAPDWQWENAVAGSVAGLATVTFSHPLDVVRTGFQGTQITHRFQISYPF
ncbi:putative mitochondrial carrier domain superfamily [Helianthus anomalus]